MAGNFQRILLRSYFATQAYDELPDVYRKAVEKAIDKLQTVELLDEFAKPLDASEDEALAFAAGTVWYFVSAQDRDGELTLRGEYQIEDEDLIVILVLVELSQGLAPSPIYRVIDVITAASPDDDAFISRLQAAIEHHHRLESPPTPPENAE